MILSVRGLTSDCLLCKSDFAYDGYVFLFSAFPQFRPLDCPLGCYRFLFAAIFDICRVCHFFWLGVFVVHGYECKVNLSEFFDFSLQGVKDESNDISICLNVFGTLVDCGTTPIAFCFESWATLFFDMDFSAIRSLLKCELDGGRYLMPTGNSINSLTNIRRILSLCGSSRSGSQSHFPLDHSSGQMNGISSRGSVSRIEIPSFVEMISSDGFYFCSSLTEIIFGSDCHVKEIDGFRSCTSLRRITIPSSVEIISSGGFFCCSSLTDVIFGSDCHVKEIDGFRSCTSLCRITIPSSVEIISSGGFSFCSSLMEVIFGSDCHVKEIGGSSDCRSLRRIEIPQSVEVITVGAFRICRVFGHR
jgi:hypothetical protein